ncbi:hypothetical protein CGBL_0121330 [Corynebacterium glutamicum]|nr:hypothetical protein CGBL_0121330 [Corynebacterium glutamicum]
MPCSRWGLPGQISHLTCRCALTAPFHPYHQPKLMAVYSLLHFPADRSGLLLTTTVLCGVRTFLGRRLGAIPQFVERNHPVASFATFYFTPRGWKNLKTPASFAELPSDCRHASRCEVSLNSLTQVGPSS